MKILPPWLIDIRVREPGSRGFRLWIPLVILWPLLLVFGVVALTVSLIVDVARLLMFRRYHHYSALLIGVFRTVNEARGTLVDVHGGDGSTVHVMVA